MPDSQRYLNLCPVQFCIFDLLSEKWFFTVGDLFIRVFVTVKCRFLNLMIKECCRMQIFSFYLNNYSPNFLTTSSRTRRCPWKFKKKFWKTQVLELFSQCYPPGKLWVPSTNFRPLGPAVWPAIGNISTNDLFYYIDHIYLFIRCTVMCTRVYVNSTVNDYTRI